MPLKRILSAVLALALLLSGCAPQASQPDPQPGGSEGPAATPAPTPTPDPVPANTYLAEAFSDYNGFLVYEGSAVSRIGVDVSSHQGEIDWEAVRGDGVEFAMLRAGYRGYTEGALHEDESFRRNAQGALAAGLEVGAYFFSQALTPAEAVEEAGYLLGLVKDLDVTFPLVFDWERQGGETSRTRDADAEVIDECAAAFCTAIQAAGYLPMVYFSPKKGYSMDLERLMEWPFWLAHYTDGRAPTSFRYDFAMWQYSNSGTVNGIDGEVDLDLCLTDLSTWRGAHP